MNHHLKIDHLGIRPLLRSPGHQSGSVIGIVLAALFLVTLTVMALNQTANMFKSTQINAASAEVIRLIHALQAWRLIEKTLTGATVDELANNGYDIAPITAADEKNLYGLAVTVVAGAVTYTLREQEQCEQLVKRIQNSTNYATDPDCDAAGVLTFTID